MVGSQNFSPVFNEFIASIIGVCSLSLHTYPLAPRSKAARARQGALCEEYAMIPSFGALRRAADKSDRLRLELDSDIANIKKS
ncbi:hypothetical protein FQZ97_1026270 [compost metagenome]